ncbi:MAG TPA: hypothetical protein VLI39_01240 [Sedimentisphaerales bacterium]|nr:hypothetical protein [Sedimentisphaerales bacterium]
MNVASIRILSVLLSLAVGRAVLAASDSHAGDRRSRVRLIVETDVWNGAGHRDNTLARWAVDLQYDFLARLDWCVGLSGEANYAPQVVLNGAEGKGILRIAARPGQQVSLDAGSLPDPDGDALAYEWFVYAEAGTYRGQAVLRDSGSPPLAAYRRVVVQVAHKHD